MDVRILHLTATVIDACSNAASGGVAIHLRRRSGCWPRCAGPCARAEPTKILCGWAATGS